MTIAADASVAIANRMIAAIQTACEPLRSFPFSGPAREHLALGLRVTFQHPYAIYYTAQPATVIIVRVLHGARDVDVIAERGGFDG